VCLCMHELTTSTPINQSTVIDALHSTHLSTCLLVLVISLTLSKLKHITATFQWKFGGSSADMKVRRNAMGREGARGKKVRG